MSREYWKGENWRLLLWPSFWGKVLKGYEMSEIQVDICIVLYCISVI